MNTGNVTYLAMAPHYWGKSDREGQAVKELRKAGYRGKDIHIFRFTGPGHANVYVNPFGDVMTPRTVQMEVL